MTETPAWQLLAFVALLGGCRGCAPAPGTDAGPSEDAGPDGAEDAADDAEAPEGAEADGAAEVPSCPPDMVRVARRFCVDRYEASLVDAASGRVLSPYYSPSRKYAVFIEKIWQSERMRVGDSEAQQMPLPELPDWERKSDFEPRAVSAPSVVPSGYVSGELAIVACRNAGKRLCTLDEWRTACRGEQDRQFPYGDTHVLGRCNMFRESHPAFLLHGNAAKGHLDPRLNLVRYKGKPLLRKTGETPTCVSEWEGDGIRDMVGNLDEWIDDPEGTFVGGFYSRSKTDGCDSIVRFHPIEYFDYSLGVRCCSDLPAPDEPSTDGGG